MSRLRDFQERFQRAVLTGDGAVLNEMKDGAHGRRDVLMRVYRDGYAVRLVRLLRGDHEMLRAYLGDAEFDALARAYIAANPPRSPLVRCLAERLPEFLRETAPYSEHPALAELALLEKSLGDAYYAADATVLELSALASLEPERWVDLRFTPHPSARRLQLRWNAAAIWTALREGKRPPIAALRDSDQPVLVWRQVDTPVFRVLSAEEAGMWDQLARGVSFGESCETLAAADASAPPAARAATYLRSWVGSGLLSRAVAYA
jgi:hypothetical protein